MHSVDQLANGFTKPIVAGRFSNFRSNPNLVAG